MNKPSIRPRLRAAATLAAAAVIAAQLGTAATADQPPPADEGAPAAAEAVDPTLGIPKQDPSPATEKIEPEVREDLEGDGEATFFLTLNDRADLQQAATSPNPARATYQAMTTFAQEHQADLVQLLEEHDADYETFWITNTIKVTGDAGLAEALAARSEVVEVRPERTITLSEPVEPTTVPAAEGVQWGVDMVNADQVWDEFGVTGEGIVIGSIDSGVDASHAILADSYRGHTEAGTSHDYNWFDPTGVCADEGPCDNNGHGTHTVGTMVGSDGYGVAPGAQWIAAKGCEGRLCSESALLAAGEWMIAPTDSNGNNPRPDLAPDIINNSWGGDRGSTWYGEILDAWHAAGIFAPFASGNYAYGRCETVDSPGDNEHTYTVGAVDADRVVAEFSGRGPAMSEGKPDLTAPGVDIASAAPGGGYTEMSGTSMATPHVSGAVALLWSAAPALYHDVEATAELLDSGAFDVDDRSCGGDAEYNYVYGHGILDVYASVSAAPIGEVGLLQGTVTDAASGATLEGASIALVGQTWSRTVVTSPDGTYQVKAPAGEYSVQITAYGYLDTEQTVTITADGEITLDASLDAAPRHDITGRVVNPHGEPVAGVTVALDAPVEPATTDEQGRYEFPQLAVGEYAVTLAPSAPTGCLGATQATLTVDGSAPEDLVLQWQVDAAGWYCAETDVRWERSTTAVPLLGDEDIAQIELPFPVEFYGQSYDSVWLNANGRIGFTDNKVGLYSNHALPSTTNPNGFIAPFWDDLLLDQRSQVRTATIDRGSRFVVEYRNIGFADDSRARLSFQVVFDADGGFTVAYRHLRGEAADGRSATVGIESPSGAVATTFSHEEAVIQNGLGLSFAATEDAQSQDGAPAANFSQEAMATAELPLAERLSPQPAEESAEESAEEDAAAEEQDVVEPGDLVFTEQSTMDTDHGAAILLDLTGSKDRLQVNEFGTFARVTSDGELVWRRGVSGFPDEWGITPARPWDSGEPAFRIPIGPSGMGLTGGDPDNGVATGDLTGDGVDDLAFIAIAGDDPGWPFQLPGSDLTYGTFITVLDGATGQTVWHTFKPWAKAIVVIDDMLVIVEQPGSHPFTEADARSVVTGYSFADGVAGAEESWTLDGGDRYLFWSAVEGLPGGLLALASTDTQVAESDRVQLLDAATGELLWSVGVPHAPRSFALDAQRDLLLGAEQSPFDEAVEYVVATYDLDDGERVEVTRRANALPLTLTVADVTQAKGAEYLVGEALLDRYGFSDATQLRVVDADGVQQWPARPIKRAAEGGDGALILGVQVVDRSIVLNWSDDSTRGLPGLRDVNWSAGITALNGKNGRLQWEKTGTVASPYFSLVLDSKKAAVETIAADHTFYRYSVKDGSVTGTWPNLGQMSQVLTIDVNDDGVEDLVAGGTAHGLLALDGTDVDDHPSILWRASLPGSVHALEQAADGSLVVAASTAVAVLDPHSGEVTATIDAQHQFVWDVEVTDLDGDQESDIVVPTDAVRAYDLDGDPMWSYEVGDGAVFSSTATSEGTVYVSYGPQAGVESDQVATAVAIDGATGQLQWRRADDSFTTPQLWNGVATGAPPVEGREAVAFAWQLPDLTGATTLLDASTGELLLDQPTASGFGHRGFVTVGERLLKYALYRLEIFDETGVTAIQMARDPWGVLPSTGPNGEGLYVMPSAGYLMAFDPDALEDTSYPQPVDDTTGGVKIYDAMISDLQGDGTDEVIGFRGDLTGLDRVLGLTGNGYWQVDNERTGMAVYHLEAP